MFKPFLDVFFGPDNKCSLEKIHTEGNGQHKILPWVERIRRDEPKETLLPVIHPTTKEVIWYGIAFSDIQFRRLGEHLLNFLGTTYSNFSGIRAVPINNNAIDQEVSRFTKGRYYRFQADNKYVWDTLETMRTLWAEKPEAEVQTIRSLGKMLRDFHLALQTGNRNIAEKELEQLKQGHYLDSKNILFLEVEMLVAFRRWQDILNLKRFPDLMNMRRPPAVTEAMIKAVYHVQVAPNLENIDRLLNSFKEEIYPLYQSLFSNMRNFSSREAITCFLIRAVVIEPQKKDWIESLLQQVDPKDELSSLLSKIAGKVHVVHHKMKSINLGLVEKSVLEGNFDEAFVFLQTLPQSVEKTKFLFDCAYELQSLESERIALQSFQLLADQEQQQFLKSRRNKEFLTYLTNEEINNQSNSLYEIPTNWVVWLEQISQKSHLENIQMAQKGSQEWSVEELLAEKAGIANFKQKLEDCINDQYTLENLYYSYPHILEFFKNDPAWPRKECKMIYLTLMELLTLSEDIGEMELSIYQDLLTALLSVGLTRKEYEDVVSSAIDLWKMSSSYTNLNWAIDVIEVLIVYPCLNNEIRLTLLKELNRQLGNFSRFIKTSDWEMIKLLHMDLRKFEEWKGIKEAYRVEEKHNDGDLESVWDKLEGKSVGIYTLMDRVSQRVKTFLDSKVQNINVHINNDKVGTDALKILSRSSDILIVATASAKHAATLFIQDERPSNLPLILCHAKGSSSMVRELEKYIEKM
ncbi:protein DpdD [Neobacillus pocheonensis]|uniref:protein DpdD n=1 Tax=Neobacillus pocheonensis TaxID=363869 RepID=UPI003D2B62A5